MSEFYPDINSNYQEKNLPAFKHIVIDGLVKSPNARTEQGQMPTVSIGNANNPKQGTKGNSIGIITQYADVLRTTVKNDTLFVSLFTKTKDAYITTGDKALLQIKATDVTSVSISYAYATITDKPSTADSLKLTVIDNGIYDVNNLYINNLSIYGSGMAQANIYGNNKIQNFNYSLLAESVLHVDGHPIQHYRIIEVDEKASIELKDKATNMQKELQ